ncbi:predicted protein [Nematostella vectensis]|uniref:Glycosyl transferase CAP10 domain-containing protein n=1 Tax=Nematostella vectensis TaxID=45351 RepID=A7RMI0_NEMVE|nr:protein O-glucosyltransferase 2 [Nematostella vectensis]EDO47272.1 predicted protein [Nematostella vectensis]|eukprot:XP_001639335.1 predicted protein [Nematostella vectensis]
MIPYRKLIIIIIASLVYLVADCAKVSRKKSIVWGPGLIAGATLPARYFYIQAVDTKGQNLTESPGENTFGIKITTSEGRARVWVQVLDRHDGSFIVRYRLFASYNDLTIEVLKGEKQVAQSPYKFKGGVYHETCYCPDKDATKWEEALECPQNYSQIDRDLARFPEINLIRLAKEAVDRFGVHHALCHYSIINNKVYRKSHGEHVGFSMFSDAIIHSLARKVHLPDMEFFVNLGDWPLEKRKDNPIPILSWCGSEDTADIVMPTYDLTEAALETMGRVSLDMLSVQANTGPKWKDKIPKAFWRGRDSREERLNLVINGRKKPELYDVALTNFFFFPYDEKKYGPKKQHVSFFNFFKYKYQLNIDGTVAAYRFPYLMGGDALVLKQDSPYYEHFYKELKPWVHYVPFKRDLSDLEERLKWAIANDDKAQKIARQAQEFARENLQSKDVFCYHWTLFKEYAKRQTTKPVKHKGMEYIKQPDDRDSKCNCRRVKHGKDEL